MRSHSLNARRAILDGCNAAAGVEAVLELLRHLSSCPSAYKNPAFVTFFFFGKVTLVASENTVLSRVLRSGCRFL